MKQLNREILQLIGSIVIIGVVLTFIILDSRTPLQPIGVASSAQPTAVVVSNMPYKLFLPALEVQL